MVSDINADSLNFRECASDFIMLCMNVARQSPAMLSIIFDKLLKLCCGVLLNLELGIFVLITIADTFSEHLVHAKEAVAIILKREG